MEELNATIESFIRQLGLSDPYVAWGVKGVWLATIFVITCLTTKLFLYVLVPVLQKVSRHTKTMWDDYLFQDKVLHKAARLLPPIIWYALLPFVVTESAFWLDLLQKVCQIYLIVVTLKLIAAFFDTLYEISTEHENLRNRPLKGVYQMFKLLAFCIGGILIISILINRNAATVLAGLGASAAVLMLIFKDSILGLVAGVQLSANDMLRPGDWITMNKCGADGYVIEVTLTTVKVQNFDMTITTIPPYTLVSDSFQNWRGMQESGGRRIKRSILIDADTVRFCTDEEMARYAKANLLTGNRESAESPLTNISVLKNYIAAYLKKHPDIHPEKLQLIRQLQSTAEGIPLEIYCFARKTEWTFYESVQDEVISHIIAKLPDFGLRLYQRPAGENIRALRS